MAGLEYRLLKADEYAKFKDVYLQAFNLVPDLENMYPMVAWQGEEIVGFLCLYTSLVMDSVWTRPNLRGTGIWKKLIRAINNCAWPKGRGYYLFVEKSGFSKNLAINSGASKEDAELWKKVF